MPSFSQDIARGPRLTDEQRQVLLDRLDATETNKEIKNRRTLPRVSFRRNDVAVRIFQPGGTVSCSYVLTRNVSAGGISFLYNSFLHKDTKVEVILTRRLGGEDTIEGTIEHCRLVDRTFHLMGVRFTNKIFPKLYLDPTNWTDLGDTTVTDPAQLNGTILHVDSQEMDRVLLQHYLKGTQIKLISVGSMAEAVDAIGKEKLDGILSELTIDDKAGEAVIGCFREAGYKGPVGILTAETERERFQAAQDAGAAAVLGKPYEASKVLGLLGSWLSVGASPAERIYSTLADQEPMKPLIQQYVERVHDLMRDLQKQTQADNLAGVRGICQALRGTGASFGFGLLSDIAKQAVTALDEAGSLKATFPHLQELELTCRRLGYQ